MQSLANKLCFAKCSWARVVISFRTTVCFTKCRHMLASEQLSLSGIHLSYPIMILSPEHSTAFTVFCCPCRNLFKTCYRHQIKNKHIFTKIGLPENKMYPTISHNMKIYCQVIIIDNDDYHLFAWQCPAWKRWVPDIHVDDSVPSHITKPAAWGTQGIQLAFPRFLFDWACMWCSGTSPIHGSIAILSVVKCGLHVLDLFQDVPLMLSQVELLGNWKPVAARVGMLCDIIWVCVKWHLRECQDKMISVFHFRP